MTKTNFTSALVLVCLALHGATSFSLNGARTRQPLTPRTAIVTSTQQQRPSPSTDVDSISSAAAIEATAGPPARPTAAEANNNNNAGLKQSLLTGCMAFLATTPLSAFAADDLEIAELPPVYVPILFAIGVLGGVGVLTASLGNVMDEEASLGLQSGARAKKERDRSRSSYFKK